MSGGREVLAGVRPLESFAGLVTRFAGVAHEAIRLEEGQAEAARRLADLQAQAATVVDRLAHLTVEADDLTTLIAAERETALAETAAACAARVAEAETTLATKQRMIESWVAQEREARERFERTAAELRATEVALIERVNTLKDLARRLAREAEAVGR